MKKVVGVMMVTVMVAVSVFAVSDLVPAYQLLQKSRNGDASAQKELVTTLEKYTEEHTDNLFAQMLLGEAYLMEARDAKENWDKMKWTNKGMQYMDKAVQNSPNDYLMRIERGITYFYMPEMLKKGQASRSDFELLVTVIEKEKDEYFIAHPDSSLYGDTRNAAAYAQAIRQLVYYYMGKNYQRDGDVDKSKDAFQKCIALNKDSRFGKMAEKEVSVNSEGVK